MSFPVSKSNQKQLRKPRNDRNLKGAKPQLTSLVDVMTILLIYLLRSFSAEGEIVPISKDLILPESTAQKAPQLSVVLIINNTQIIAENKLLTTTEKVLNSEDMIIPELSDWLQSRRETTQKIEQFSTTTKFKGDITIQGDKRIRFLLLKKIMYTCGQQGFNNFSLAVLKKGA